MGIQRELFNTASIYEETIKDMQSMIIGKYGSVLKFCEQTGVDRFNLSKVFTAIKKENNTKSMSIGLYFRICVELGMMERALVDPAIFEFDMPLRDYMLVDNNQVMRTIIMFNRN